MREVEVPESEPVPEELEVVPVDLVQGGDVLVVQHLKVPRGQARLLSTPDDVVLLQVKNELGKKYKGKM